MVKNQAMLLSPKLHCMENTAEELIPIPSDRGLSVFVLTEWPPAEWLSVEALRRYSKNAPPVYDGTESCNSFLMPIQSSCSKDWSAER